MIRTVYFELALSKERTASKDLTSHNASKTIKKIVYVQKNPCFVLKPGLKSKPASKEYALSKASWKKNFS